MVTNAGPLTKRQQQEGICNRVKTARLAEVALFLLLLPMIAKHAAVFADKQIT